MNHRMHQHLLKNRPHVVVNDTSLRLHIRLKDNEWELHVYADNPPTSAVIFHRHVIVATNYVIRLNAERAAQLAVETVNRARGVKA